MQWSDYEKLSDLYLGTAFAYLSVSRLETTDRKLDQPSWATKRSLTSSFRMTTQNRVESGEVDLYQWIRKDAMEKSKSHLGSVFCLI